MYVKMRNYPEFYGSRWVADTVFFWIKDDPNSEEDTIKDKFANWLYGNHENPTRFQKFCEWIHKKRCDRRVTVRIDKHDTWKGTCLEPDRWSEVGRNWHAATGASP